MNWFQRHLNWTMVFAILAQLPIGYIVGLLTVLVNPYVSTAVHYAIVYLITIAWVFVIGGWVLSEKNRSLWNLLWLIVPYIGLIVFLCLENKRQYPHLIDERGIEVSRGVVSPRRVNWQHYLDDLNKLGLVGKGFSKKSIAEQVVMLERGYVERIEKIGKKSRVKNTREQVNGAYNIIANILEQQIENNTVSGIDFEILKEAIRKTIYCEDCGNRLSPYLEITSYDKETGRPKYIIHYKCRNRFVITKRHEGERINLA